MYKMACAVLFIFCLIGCASPGLPGGYNVVISDDFSSEEISNIEIGLTNWSSYNDGPLFTFDVESPFSLPQEKDVQWDQIVIRKADISYIHFLCNDPRAAGCTAVRAELAEEEEGKFNMDHSAIGATSYLPSASAIENDNNSLYQMIAAHEAGHAMGLRHTGKGTLMYPSGDDDPVPTCADLQYYCRIRYQSCTCDQK